jgi:hypothetical protein
MPRLKAKVAHILDGEGTGYRPELLLQRDGRLQALQIDLTVEVKRIDLARDGAPHGVALDAEILRAEGRPFVRIFRRVAVAAAAARSTASISEGSFAMI